MNRKLGGAVAACVLHAMKAGHGDASADSIKAELQLIRGASSLVGCCCCCCCLFARQVQGI